MPYAMLVWDFDGTLADTLPSVLEIFNQVGPEFGLHPITDPESFRDKTPAEFLKQQKIPLWKLPALRQVVVSRQRGTMPHIRLHPGIPEVLAELAQRGCRLGILSSNSEENIRVCLRANGAESWFDFVVGYPRLLGKKHVLRRILRRAGLAAPQLLYLGDEVRDIAAARDAGTDVAAVTWGVNSAHLLQQHAPTLLIDRPAQLLDLPIRAK